MTIFGSGGCGESTVNKLITGLYQPWEGEILFDGKPISRIPQNVFTGSVAMMDQDIVLFEDTTVNIIRMWDRSIADLEVVLAARDAQIHDDILQRPDDYQRKLTEKDGYFAELVARQRLDVAE